MGGVEKTIIIGNNTQIGYGTTIIATTHIIGRRKKRAGEKISKAVVIGDGCWIGANVTVLPGVSIGDGTIIGAGSIVTKDCENDCLYAGNPAIKIKKLDN